MPYRNQFTSLQTLAERSGVSTILHSARKYNSSYTANNLCLRRSLRGEDALETFAVLQEDQNPQHASDQSRRDGAG